MRFSYKGYQVLMRELMGCGLWLHPADGKLKRGGRETSATKPQQETSTEPSAALPLLLLLQVNTDTAHWTLQDTAEININRSLSFNIMSIKLLLFLFFSLILAQ